MQPELYKKDTYLNKNILYLFNREIYEYDMEEAGFSLIQEFSLLSDKKVSELKKIGKEKRKIKIGLIQKKDEKFKENLKQAFVAAREMFFRENALEADRVISIKKDAIFTISRCEKEKLGKFIRFRKKHEYTSYIYLPQKREKSLEIYYAPMDFSIKGISNEYLQYHEDYMILFLKKYFYFMETGDKTSILQFMRRFIDKYKNRKLDIGYYRNFNTRSDYSVINEDDVIYMDYENLDEIDISYNFFNILLKLLKIPL